MINAAQSGRMMESPALSSLEEEKVRPQGVTSWLYVTWSNPPVSHTFRRGLGQDAHYSGHPRDSGRRRALRRAAGGSGSLSFNNRETEQSELGRRQAACFGARGAGRLPEAEGASRKGKAWSVPVFEPFPGSRPSLTSLVSGLDVALSTTELPQSSPSKPLSQSS